MVGEKKKLALRGSRTLNRGIQQRLCGCIESKLWARTQGIWQRMSQSQAGLGMEDSTQLALGCAEGEGVASEGFYSEAKSWRRKGRNRQH